MKIIMNPPPTWRTDKSDPNLLGIWFYYFCVRRLRLPESWWWWWWCGGTQYVTKILMDDDRRHKNTATRHATRGAIGVYRENNW